MRAFSVILMTMTALLLVGCGDKSERLNSTTPLGGGNVHDATIFNQPSVFYRVEASYEFLPTGEIIAFNYVASCFNKEVPGSFSPEMLPSGMYKPTSTGAAIGIQTMQLCGERGVFPEKGGVPHPFTIVFPDVNDLNEGWGYANYHAYESPRAEIKFITGKITKTDRTAFMKWFEAAPLKYTQIGALPGPHGHQMHPTKEQIARNNGRKFSANVTGNVCSGYSRVPLSEEITKILRELTPQTAGRYWTSDVTNRELIPMGWDVEAREKATDLYWDIRKHLPDVDGMGRPLGHYRHGGTSVGTLNKEGKGAKVNYEKNIIRIAPDIYPFLDSSNDGAWPKGVEPVEGYYAQQLLLDNDYKGFVKCGSTLNSKYRTTYKAYLKTPRTQRSKFFAAGEKTLRYIGDQPVFLHRMQDGYPWGIFDNEGYFFLKFDALVLALEPGSMSYAADNTKTEALKPIKNRDRPETKRLQLKEKRLK